NLEKCGNGLVPREMAIVGFARTHMSIEDFRKLGRASVGVYGRLEVDEASWRVFEDKLDYMSALDEPDGFRKLRTKLEENERKRGVPPNRIFYLSIPPEAIRDSIERLAEAGLISTPGSPHFTRVVVEKPIGHDLKSALQISAALRMYLDE